ncbi:diguanylate cyclase [Roseibacterium sp. SDUM158017]|uniref:diguanylate cyclase domain-containing protein n=1 Tax=Roseicyclus salinarum TaxID=3036773 RepID=UPI002414DCE0|nr:diguanylate cyclase [Roseibacterium sp. SDUM158017]MDG4649217.1 diguanylate cyclase [Roseibacterium sp. SDUM158017]
MLEIGSLGMCLGTFSPGAPSYVAAALATALIPFAVWLSRHQNFPGQHALTYAHIGAMWWLWTAAFELAVPEAPCKILASAVSHAGIALVGTAWLCFVYRYTVGVSIAGHRAQNMLMLTVPVTAAGMALTSDVHGMFYTPATRLVADASGAYMDYDHGPLFYVALTYVYSAVCLSLILLLKAAASAQHTGQLRYWLLLMLGLVPTLGSFSHMFFGLTLWGYDPSPFMFSIVIVIYAFMLISDNSLDLSAVARRHVYNFLPQAIFVVSGGDRLMSGNRAARNLLENYSAPEDGPQDGESAILEAFEHARADQRRRSVALPVGNRFYDVEVQPIEPAVGRDHPPLGWIMIADDVSATVLLQSELARAAKNAAADAERDPLTGLSNRRPLEPRFRELVAEAAAADDTLQLAMVDVDHFKSINDTYGHDEGDKALVFVANALRGVFRDNDAVFRVGGEEFMIIAAGMPQRALLHRLRMARARLQETVQKDGVIARNMTFSAGIAEWPTDGPTLDQLARHADRRLLEAKRSGRNLFIGHDPVFVGSARLGMPSDETLDFE